MIAAEQWSLFIYDLDLFYERMTFPVKLEIVKKIDNLSDSSVLMRLFFKMKNNTL